MVTKRQIENTTVYLLFSLFIQFSAIEIRRVFSHTKLTISWLQWLEKGWGARARWWAIDISNWQSSISRQIRHVFNVRVHRHGARAKWRHKLFAERMRNANVILQPKKSTAWQTYLWELSSKVIYFGIFFSFLLRDRLQIINCQLDVSGYA